MKKNVKTVLLFAFLCSITSCMVATSLGTKAIAGKDKTTEQKFSLTTQNQTIEEKKTLLKSRLFSEGWKKSSETENSIMFVKKTGGIKELISKNEETQIFAVFTLEKTDYYISFFGKKSKNTPKKIEEIFSEIQNKEAQL